VRPRPAALVSALLVALALFARGSAAHAAQSTASPEEQYRYLAGLAEKGMNELAVQEAQAFLHAYPKHEKANLARYRLAGALWELGKRDEAMREYETLGRSERFEYRAECLFRVGETAAARGDEAHARAAFEGVLTGGQDYLLPPARLQLAELDFRARRFPEAERRYDELLRLHADSAEAPLARRGLAWCAWERGDAAETVERTRAFLRDERDPERRDELALLLGEALLGSDPKAALEAFRGLKTPAQAEARARGEAFALAALGDHAGAARAFEGLLERAPEGPYAHEATLQAGVERLRTGDARGAQRRLAEAAKSGDAEALYWLALAQKQGGDAKAALASLELALRARPSAELGARIQVLRGDCLAADGRAGEALKAYEASGSESALEAAAITALNQGDARGAAQLAERALAADPRGERAQGARTVLAEALFAGKDYTGAERAFEAALAGAATPEERARLTSRRAWCPYLAGDLPGARERFAALLEQYPKAPEAEEALALLVRIALEQNDAETAAPLAQRYLERYPSGRFVDQSLLAQARASTGREARERFESWLTRFPEHASRAAVLLGLAELESAAGAHADAARRYTEVQQLAPGTAEAAQASYGLAWCAWEQHDLAGAARTLGALVRDPAAGATPAGAARVTAALELLVWVQVEQKELDASLATWRALAKRKGDEGRRFEGAKRILAALEAEQRYDDAQGLLDECARSLSQRALVAETQLESAYLELARGDAARAEAALAKAQKSGASAAGLAEASYHVGEARLAAGDAPRALELFTRASANAEHPRAEDALYKLGFVQLERGERAAAAKTLASLIERYPAGAFADEARFLLGECAYRDGNWAEAARLCLAAKAQASGELRAKALFRAGLALGQLERWSESEAALAELAQGFPQFPNLAAAELGRGHALAAQKKGRAARAAYERVLALDSGALAAHARLGVGTLAEAEGRLDDALSEYLKVALLYADDAAVGEALFSAGRVLEAQGNGEQARARYAELVGEHADSAFADPARERLRALGTPPRSAGRN
jgi:TolA-binding protein